MGDEYQGYYKGGQVTIEDHLRTCSCGSEGGRSWKKTKAEFGLTPREKCSEWFRGCEMADGLVVITADEEDNADSCHLVCGGTKKNTVEPLHVLVLGSTGIGKSTLINYFIKQRTEVTSGHKTGTTKIHPYDLPLVPGSVEAKIWDSPGLYDDQGDAQNDEYAAQIGQILSKSIANLYAMSATDRGLRDYDKRQLRKLTEEFPTM